MTGNEGSTSPADAMLRWAECFNTRDPARIVTLYADEALLFGTSKSRLYAGKQQIAEYFTGASTVQLAEHTIRNLGPDTALSVGTYIFTRMKDGTVTPARFSFVLTRQKNGWMILHHHSSAYPEQ
jgi:uncharacterized protein (TIGR02246 family)